ncbi:MAG: hypothetical protein WD673_11070 [Alphaproteobacteria bacterium]
MARIEGFAEPICALSTVGHLTLIRAYRLAFASLLAPYNDASILFATVLGYLIFGTLPDVWTVIGAGVLIASGVYVFHREAMARRRGESG